MKDEYKIYSVLVTREGTFVPLAVGARVAIGKNKGEARKQIVAQMQKLDWEGYSPALYTIELELAEIPGFEVKPSKLEQEAEASSR